jgi:hypothetical protein
MMGTQTQARLDYPKAAPGANAAMYAVERMFVSAG